VDQPVENKLLQTDHFAGVDSKAKNREYHMKAVNHLICHFGFNSRISELQVSSTK